MDPCWQAPTTDLCTAACKAQLAKLPDRCLTRLADEVAKQGNTNVTARLQEQLTACGRNITVPASAAGPAWGSVLVPLAVVGLSAALLELLRP